MSESLEALAENLWRVRTSGGQVPVAAASELATVADAYRVQRIDRGTGFHAAIRVEGRRN